ncbi:hypothetical protein GOP47_0014489 [Adiantum capillus-veneris]|uniref:GEX2 N-terminal Ig-like domain-containing protein n=1 Tax=Adiantum capillus-veneris TaxID=13818 RepID=A0A9D4ULP2_ADICA|nr:hypothetical protein GOP47_0014489 [Adiantum capillus-veneris]
MSEAGKTRDSSEDDEAIARAWISRPKQRKWIHWQNKMLTSQGKKRSKQSRKNVFMQLRCTRGLFILLLTRVACFAELVLRETLDGSLWLPSEVTGFVSLNHSIGEWVAGVNIVVAGSKAKFYVQLRDANNNRISGSAIQGQKLIGRVTTVPDKEETWYQSAFVPDAKTGYLLFQFATTKAAHYLLYVTDGEGGKLLNSPFGFNVTAGDISVHTCIADWIDGKDTFRAGEEASLLISLKDSYNNSFNAENGRLDFFEFSLNISGAAIYNVSVSSQGGTGYETVKFIPSFSGKFLVQVGDNNGTQVLGSPLTLYVEPGPLSVAQSLAEWVNGNSFQAGSPAFLKIVMKDAYQNVLNTSLNSQTPTFKAAMVAFVGVNQSFVQTKYTATSGLGYEILKFVPYETGKFRIWVGKENVNISNSPLDFSVLSGVVSIAHCQGSWSNDINSFKAGDQATLYISLWDAFGNAISSTTETSQLNFTVKVQGRKGESIYIFGIKMATSYDNVAITFLTCLAGNFTLQVEGDGEEIGNSPLAFSVGPGNLSIHSCVGTWKDGINSSKPGEELKLMILLKDAFGNILVSSTNESASSFLTPSTMDSQGELTDILKYHFEFESDAPGYVFLLFKPQNTGRQLLEIGKGNEYLFNSPFPFFVEDGPISLQHTYAKWKYGIDIFPPYQGVKLYVYQRDAWGNALESLVDFQVLIYRENDTEPSPFSDVWSQAAYDSGKGTQLITFTTTASGFFRLYLEDSSGNNIGGCPYKFSVLASHLVQENNTVVYGSWLNASTAGEVSTIFVQLKDLDGENVDGYSESVFALISIGGEDEMKVSGNKVINSTGLYKLNFVLTRSGEHKILLLYCNIPLNSGDSFTKVVYPGEVNITQTVLIPTDGTVPHPYVTLPHPVILLLKDKYGNLVPGQKMLLTAKFYLHVTKPPTYSSFQEVTTGNYSVVYQAYEIQPVLLSIFYRDKLLPGFPLELYIHSYGYFPHPMNDVIWTWEDTAISIDVLLNDYFGLKPGILTNIIKQPINGVTYIRGQKIVYVPQKGFLGNDSLIYEVQDDSKQADKNLVHTETALATIFVVKHPPIIVSIPEALEICEEGSTPIKSGDKAFMIFYSEAPLPVAYAQISTDYGHLQTTENFDLSWEPSQIYTTSTSVESNNSLSNSTTLELVGESDEINSALNALVYTGALNFHGYDKVWLSIKDEAGLGEEASIIVKVKHINTPPIITSYPFILVDSNTGNFLAGIDDIGRETYNASFISVVDYDFDESNDDTSQLEILIQVEEGSLILTLPENRTSSTEVRHEDSYHWSPLPTAVFENHVFTTQAQGIKFRATLEECNNALQELRYNGTVDSTTLLIKANDLGHSGMDSMCSTENNPLSVEKQLILVFIKPMPLQTLYSSWSKVVMRTRALLVVGILMVFTFMALIICLFILVACRQRRSKQKVKGYLYQESNMDASRFYNPMWIPSAPSSPKFEFLNSSNPHHYNLQKNALKQGLSDAHEEMEASLGFHIKKHWASIKSFRGLSFKMKLGRARDEG